MRCANGEKHPQCANQPDVCAIMKSEIALVEDIHAMKTMRSLLLGACAGVLFGLSPLTLSGAPAQNTAASPTASAPSVVKVTQTGKGFALLRNGQPYFIRGGGGHHYLETLRAAGGNSIRTWGEDDIEPLLDRAQQLGLTVTIGIWLGQERQGFNYADPAQVRGEVEKTRRFIRRYRHHPALLMWA